MATDAIAVIGAALVTGLFLVLSKVWDRYFSDKDKRGHKDADLMRAEDDRVRLSDERQQADYNRLTKHFEEAEHKHKLERMADREVIKRLTTRVAVLETVIRESNLTVPAEVTDPHGNRISD